MQQPLPRRNRFRSLLCAALAAIWLAGAAPQPVAAGLFGDSEAALGAQEHPKILQQFGGAVKDRKLQAYIDALGRRLAATTERARDPWTFTVLDSDVVNAFALPGGYVYVTRGLLALAKDEAEVAGVLAHEIGHVTAHHSAERQTRQTITGLLAAGVGLVLGSPELGQLAELGGGALVASYSRGQELEADQLGVATLERAGYDPFAMATFLETLRRDSQYQSLRGGTGEGEGFDFFASHPQTEDRVRKAADLARARPTGGARPVDPYLAAVDGMIYGDSPENGFVRGRTFAHPGLGVTFSVPQGYQLLNGAEQVIAKGNGAAIMFDGGPAPGTGDPAAYLAQVWAKDSPVQGLQRLTIGGMPAATGLTQGQTDSGTVDIRLVAIQFDSGTIYRFTFLAPSGGLSRFDRDFQATANSFRRLSRQEAAGLQPRRIRVVTVQPGQQVGDFVRRMPQEPYAEELFRIVNDLPPGTPLPPGRRIKLIEGS